MAYEFTKLSEVYDTATVSDECNVIIEDGGEIKKTAKSNIGKAQVQADWNQTDPTQPDYIKNKLSCDLPYQHLVTDGEGGAKWEDRLAYEFFNPLIEQVTVSCTTALTEIEGYAGKTYYGFGSMQEALTASSTFEVIYDGTRYVVERHALSDSISINGYNFVQYVGDPYLEEYPFAIEFNYEHNTVFTKTSGEHTFIVNTYNIKQIDQKYIKDMYYDNSQSASFALCTSGYAIFPQGRDYYDVPDEMWKLLLNENATIRDEVSGAVMMDRRVDESNGVVYYSTGDSSGVTELCVSTIYRQAYLFDTGLPDEAIGKERHTVTASIGDIKQIDQKFIPPQTVYVNATGGDLNENDIGELYTNVTLDKTYDEISALLSRGVDVKIIRDNIILNYLNFNEAGIMFLAYYPFDDQATLGCAIQPDNSAIVVVGRLADSFLPIDINGELVAPLILKSSTPGSSKKFKITVDDSGTITATEV